MKTMRMLIESNNSDETIGMMILLTCVLLLSGSVVTCGLRLAMGHWRHGNHAEACVLLLLPMMVAVAAGVFLNTFLHL